MVDEKKIEILDKAFDRLKDFETLMDNFESRFSKFGQNFVTMPKRPYLPIYNEKADYNTNAQSYYDYLARINRYLHEIEIVINIILERLEHLEDIETKQTLSITPTQIGKLKDISELVNNVNISLGTIDFEIHGIKKEISNDTLIADWGLGSEKSGLFSKDLTPYLEDIYIKIDIINDNLNRLDNVDVGNHLSLSSDKNTLSLSRKTLKGTVLTSDKVPVGIGDILNEITNIWNFINNISGGGGELTVYEPIWNGDVGEGGTLPHLENGQYLITVVSDVLGAFDINIQFNNSAPINFNSVISPYAPASPDGTIWVLQAILTGANSPVFKTTMTKNVGGSSSVSSNNGCHIKNIKKIVTKKL